eukprot:CAMPEP_0178404734 /NCGR_PEP_ID=MMETSP0689_2-20121128/18040_1 /TAXON_ID=160604 /ORGANISM="Amphidinium massartii, Strain CS-259" /LENGTH=225 /DNA_ID=CAMNT_0020025735 /DNA_START=79 /DNA_END=756 /DNA_ORIENTATION=+
MARRSRVPRVVSLCCLALAAAAAGTAFVGLRAAPRVPSATARMAEGGASSSESAALVKIDDANVKATASVLAGIAGLLVGGIWIGAGLFAASSYAARREDDVGSALRGVSKTALEALNFASNMDGKYKVTDNLSKTVSSAAEKNLKPADKANLDSAVGTVTSSVGDLDKEVGIKGTLGNIVLSASDLAAQAVDKLLDFNEKNKVTDKLASQVSDLASKAQSPKKQ